jgi:hypothetical protein
MTEVTDDRIQGVSRHSLMLGTLALAATGYVGR